MEKAEIFGDSQEGIPQQPVVSQESSGTPEDLKEKLEERIEALEPFIPKEAKERFRALKGAIAAILLLLPLTEVAGQQPVPEKPAGANQKQTEENRLQKEMEELRKIDDAERRLFGFPLGDYSNGERRKKMLSKLDPSKVADVYKRLQDVFGDDLIVDRAIGNDIEYLCRELKNIPPEAKKKLDEIGKRAASNPKKALRLVWEEQLRAQYLGKAKTPEEEKEFTRRFNEVKYREREEFETWLFKLGQAEHWTISDDKEKELKALMEEKEKKRHEDKNPE